ncbi:MULTISPECIES: ribbon-helix-helix protein, CopG family [unclassified Nostoc]|uniref:ribbon-helix-helix protein, CopG family n=1 Tax=unclassified Nostoc TaxID=2593658 RepID=UPI002AD4D00E|nr:ribbon-helix-helix protein, CopG family [Nostoc sp. DedQUE05]MDZ8096704.1 ribbon-helix-helix protein, CopG family [Nostoc sp. DedQUE05]
MGRKAKTAVHGMKKKDVTVTLTPEGVEMLDIKANLLGISRSELIERIARGQVTSDSEAKRMGELLTT